MRGLAIVLLAAGACAAGGEGTESGNFDGTSEVAPGDPKADGYDFIRQLNVRTWVDVEDYSWLSGAQAEGEFDERRYATVAFDGQAEDEVRIVSSTWGSTLLGVWTTQHAVFEWIGPSRCDLHGEDARTEECAINSPKHWSLVRKNTVTNGELTFTLPHTNHYLVLILTTESAYSWKADWAVNVWLAKTQVANAPAQIEGRVFCSDNLTPAKGYRLGLGQNEATTDDSGKFRLPEVPSGGYNVWVKLGAYEEDGYSYVDRTFIPGYNFLHLHVSGENCYQ